MHAKAVFLKEGCHPEQREGSVFRSAEYVAEWRKADPSTPFGAKSAPNSTQDDNIMVVLYVDTT
jgi:hypothetical protein